MDHMTGMSTFVKVVSSGGFSAAARSLGLAPSRVTSHVQALEQRLGVRLLNRSTRKIGLTEVGQAYYERCVRILTDVADADRIVQALQSTPRGTLRLDASLGMPAVIGPVMSRFVALHPEVRVEMTISDRMVDLVEEGVDLSIRAAPVPESSLIVRRLASYRFVVCGAPEYLSRHGAPQTPGDLLGHNCLMFSEPHPWGDEWVFAGPGGEQRVAVSGNFRSNSAMALHLAALNGQGLLAATPCAVAGDLEAGRLLPVLTGYRSGELPILAVYPHRQHLSAKVRCFIDLLVGHFRADPLRVHSATIARPGRSVPIDQGDPATDRSMARRNIAVRSDPLPMPAQIGMSLQRRSVAPVQSLPV
jgi:DNA-binding transcriptional LysR family regulator